VFGLFGSDDFHDDTLGTFKRKGRWWIGSMPLVPHGDVALRLTGDRKTPDSASRRLVAALAPVYAALRPAITAELCEHYEAGREAMEDESPGEMPKLTNPADVWRGVTVQSVDIDAGRAEFPIEIRLTVAWDEEHTLGARIAQGRLVELCGSVGP
jgi:hypothetical protein